MRETDRIRRELAGLGAHCGREARPLSDLDKEDRRIMEDIKVLGDRVENAALQIAAVASRLDEIEARLSSGVPEGGASGDDVAVRFREEDD